MSLKSNVSELSVTHKATGQTTSHSVPTAGVKPSSTTPEPINSNTHYLHYVTVHNPEDKDSVHAELMAPTGSHFIPSRAVECVKSYPGSLHNGSFMLTPAEAETLKQDVRIRNVQIDPKLLGVVRAPAGVRHNNYAEPLQASNTIANWGLARCISKTPNFTTSTTTPLTLNTYTYNLDGSGVDIVMIDTGVEPGHPEFAVNADGTGGSRVVDIDWTQFGIITSVPTGGFLGDGDGHGSNCASIAAGNTCGWAPGAAIYSLRFQPGTSILDGTTALGNIDLYECWQTIRAFHLAKTPDPITGYVRPTIVSASLGTTIPYSALTMESITWRGNTYTTSTADGAYGTIDVGQNFYAGGSSPFRDGTEDADVEACIAAGVIVVAAAGNDCHKADVPGGIDYNNYWLGNLSGTNYAIPYHQGSSPGAADGVICVGADGNLYDYYGLPWSGDQKDFFSGTGPRVDVFAPGTWIQGAYGSQGYISSSTVDARNSSYYVCQITGTSQATPQVTGVCAQLMQLRPWYTPAQVSEWIKTNSVKGILNENAYQGYLFGSQNQDWGDGEYTNFASLQGSPGGVLYNPFNNPTPLTIS